mgnify:CR=1 FL=1
MHYFVIPTYLVNGIIQDFDWVFLEIPSLIALWECCRHALLGDKDFGFDVPHHHCVANLTVYKQAEEINILYIPHCFE